MRVLFFGTYDAGRHPRIRTLQEGFAEFGDEVLERNAPLGFDTAARVRMLQRPWLLPELGARMVSRWWQLWRTSRNVPTVDAIVVGYMGHFDIHLARWLWRRSPIALDHMISARDTAVDRGVRQRWIAWALGRLDLAAVRAADIPFVDTDEHLDLLSDQDRRRAVVVSVGAPADWFHEPRPSPEGSLSVIFFGLYTPLQGTPVIGSAIRSLGDEEIRFTMVGTGQELSTARARTGDNPGVTWIDWVGPDELPGLVASHDVCLGIFAATRKAMRVVPNKVFQGAAAGCAIVTSDTEPQRRALGDSAIFVPPDDPDALAEALLTLAHSPDELAAYRDAAYQRASVAFRPSVVVEPLRKRLTGAAS
jgi:glycosyltransferase involved in cell wall biosynthesis